MDDDQLSRAQEDIRNYLELVYEVRTQSGARGGGGGGGKTVAGNISLDTSEWETAAPDVDPDDSFGWDVSYTAIAQSLLTPVERRECAANDECPAEYASSEELIRTGLPDPRAALDTSSFSTIISGATTHIEMSNQLFWMAYSTPLVQEIAIFIDLLFREFRKFRVIRPAASGGDELPNLSVQSATPSEEQLQRLEAFMLGLIMIATGASVDRACDIQVYESAPEESKVDLALVLTGDAARAWWLVKAPLPAYKTTEVNAGLTSIVSLPDVLHARKLVRLLFRFRHLEAESGRPRKLFVQNSRHYTSLLRKLLSNFVDPDGRTTIAKLPRFIFTHLVRVADQDVGDAICATAYYHPLGYVPTFYSTPYLSRLKELYVTTAQQLGAAIKSAIRGLNKTPTPDPSQVSRERGAVHLAKTDLRVGNRACPTRELAKGAVSAIHNDIRRLIRQKERGDKTDLHNLITLWVLEFFAAATGVRAVSSPLLRLEQIDVDTGFAVLTEKTVRPVWLPPEMIKQVKSYDRYLRTQTLIQPRPHFGFPYPAPCFLIDIDGRPLEITPTMKIAYLEKYFNYPASIFRRFIRNELRGSGCPAPVVEAWLSHAPRGTETYHKYSHFSLGAYRQALRHYLMPILVDLGFEAIEL